MRGQIELVSGERDLKNARERPFMPQVGFKHLHHATSHPYRFFGRAAELRALDDALETNEDNLVAFVGPGGQGKTAIVQEWLKRLAADPARVEGVFLWSFYRGKDADRCLRQLLADVDGTGPTSDVSSSFCVDRLLELLTRRKWAVVLDGLEVVQYDGGAWFGRIIHPELGRLLQELSSAPASSLLVVTTRFPLPELAKRRHARLLTLGSLDVPSAREMLRTLGVRGEEGELDAAAASCGRHAKAVELLRTYLGHFRGGKCSQLPDAELSRAPVATDEEWHVARILAAHQTALTQEAQDILALATAFREPPTRAQVLDYLRSEPVQHLLHEAWGRDYAPFTERAAGWLELELQRLLRLRLLEEVDPGGDSGSERVIDAHPLVRRGFEHVLGAAGRRQSATARAGFLRGRPDRRRAANLTEAREVIELFYAYCDAGMWEEADRTYLALDKPRYRFVAPALERDLLLRFFPDRDWRRPPLWPRFAHWRGLAVCLELLGQFEEALAVYREEDAALRGDALIALGRLEPLLECEQAAHPWQILWQAYRAHALCLAGRTEEAVTLAASLVPVDVYEWTHVFECLLRAGRLETIDMRSFLHRPPSAAGQRWADLARMRMRLDYLRITAPNSADLGTDYPQLLDQYDRAGLPYERCLAHLGYASWLLSRGDREQAAHVTALTVQLALRFRMRLLEADAHDLAGRILHSGANDHGASVEMDATSQLRSSCSVKGCARP
jgi:hypothetical protein